MEDIDNTNRNFKGQMGTEEVLCFCRKHWVVILPHLAGFIFGGFIFFPYLVFADKDAVIRVMAEPVYKVSAFIIAIGLTYLLHRFFIRLFNFYLQIFIITNYRIVDIDKTVFFRDNRDAIDLPEIQDMKMKQNGLIPTLLEYGELHILLSSVSEPKCFYFIPNPAYHFSKINKTKREYILKRQFAKQAYAGGISSQTQTPAVAPDTIEQQIRQGSIPSQAQGGNVYTNTNLN